MNKRRIQVPTTRCAAWLGPHELIILAELSGGSVGESQPARVALMVVDAAVAGPATEASSNGVRSCPLAAMADARALVEWAGQVPGP